MSEPSALYGLILAGGKSTRMGQDKSLLQYFGRPHQDVLYEMAEAFCERTFLSVRKDQYDPESQTEVVLDEDQFRGPFNGLLSAHNRFPDVAWLVIACDLPFINSTTLSQLVEARDATRLATAMATRASGLPEPLAAIWEPEALARALDYLPNADSSCPRKFLLQQDIKLVHPDSDDVLINANHPEDLEKVLQMIQSNKHG